MFEYLQKYIQSFHFMTLRKRSVNAALVHSARKVTTSLNRNDEYTYICTYELLRCLGL